MPEKTEENSVRMLTLCFELFPHVKFSEQEIGGKAQYKNGKTLSHLWLALERTDEC